MKRFTSKFLAIALAAASVLSVAACGGGGEKKDDKKTQLNVNVYKLGLGTEFAASLKQKFEAAYADQSFEKGKMGVQVMYSYADINGDSLSGALATKATDLLYVHGLNITEYANVMNGTSDGLEDISDVMTEGGENSIHARLFDSAKDYYNLGTEASPKYFAVPWFSSYYGTVYDVSLFKEKHLKNNDPAFPDDEMYQYEGLDGIIGNDDDTYGPDGKTGKVGNSDYTLDDGLPATWDDFWKLMNLMKAEDVIPFVFTDSTGYPESWLKALWLDYEGKDNYELIKSFNGTYTYKDADGNLQTKEITNENGYEVAYQNGKKLAISVAERLVGDGYVDSASFSNLTDNHMAQEIFVKSNFKRLRPAGSDSKKDNKPIAFLMEGTWWENEAKLYFDEVVEDTGDESQAYGVREYGFMPFPKMIKNGVVNASANVHQTTLRSGDVGVTTSALVLNKKSEKKTLAKEFIKFAYSNEMNVDFTIQTGVTKSMSYAIGESDLQKITPFQRNIYQLTQNDNVVNVSGSTRNQYIVKEPTLIQEITGFTSKMDSKVSNVFSTFKEDGVSAAEYWQGVLDRNFEEDWTSKFVNK